MARRELNQPEELTLEEAKALRAAKHYAVPKKVTELDKRESFRVFWAQEKSKYGMDKKLESILWMHLKAIGMDTQDKFKAGLQNFGLKEVKK